MIDSPNRLLARTAVTALLTAAVAGCAAPTAPAPAQPTIRWVEVISPERPGWTAVPAARVDPGPTGEWRWRVPSRA